jgi:single-strand DNA-binding protein
MLNSVILVGYLGSQPEIRTTNANSALTVLSVATKRVWRDRESGEKVEATDWHRCSCFGQLAEFCAQLAKGAHVQITGSLHSYSYTGKDGAKKSRTEVRIQRLTRLDRASQNPSTEAAA